MSKNKHYTVFLDTGVSISLPSHVDLDTKEGYEIFKKAASEKLKIILNSDEASFEWERADEYYEDGQ